MAKYKVSGYCLVPMHAVIDVDAESAEQAIKAAMVEWRKDKARLIESMSMDESSACDWRPTATAI